MTKDGGTVIRPFPLFVPISTLQSSQIRLINILRWNKPCMLTIFVIIISWDGVKKKIGFVMNIWATMWGGPSDVLKWDWDRSVLSGMKPRPWTCGEGSAEESAIWRDKLSVLEGVDLVLMRKTSVPSLFTGPPAEEQSVSNVSRICSLSQNKNSSC